SRMKTAFLGLGAIGRPMAKCIAGAGHELTVWNRTPGRAEELATTIGATAASTPADAARDADVVITCLSNSPDVESLLDGPSGLLGALQRGSVLVDCTSGEPGTSRRIAARLAERGVDFLDAPVSCGVGGGGE